MVVKVVTACVVVWVMIFIMSIPLLARVVVTSIMMICPTASQKWAVRNSSMRVFPMAATTAGRHQNKNRIVP